MWQLQKLLPFGDHQLFTIVRRLTDGAVPIMFWTGYSAIVLVHSAFLEKWTVIVSECPLTKLHPRRWYDIDGRRIPSCWEAALRSVMGVVIFRPGITQVCGASEREGTDADSLSSRRYDGA